MLSTEQKSRLEQKLSEAGYRIKYRKLGELVLHKCPLHKDRTPSLSVNVTKGQYKCLSCNDKGSVSKLLSYYGIKYGNYNQIVTIDELESMLEDSIYEADQDQETSISFKADVNELKKYRYYHPYLESRGFNKEFVLANKIGFDKETLRVTIPIFFKGSYWGCIKRSVIDDIPKVAYADNMPKNRLLYLPLSNTGNSKYFVVTEGFSDALKSSLYGQDSCAILGCLISEEQMKLVYEQAQGRDIMWALDNDNPGKAGLDRALSMTKSIDSGKIFCYDGLAAKDIGEMTKEQFNQGIENAQLVWEL